MRRVEVKRIYQRAKSTSYPTEYAIIQAFMYRFNQIELTIKDLETIVDCCNLEEDKVKTLLKECRNR